MLSARPYAPVGFHQFQAALIDFEDASGFDNRGPFLSFGKPLRTLAIDINARKFFTVMIEDGDLPVLVFAASITLHAGRRPFCLFLLQVS